MHLALLGLLAPFVLLADLGLLLGTKVIGNVEGAADLLGGLSLDHGGDGGAGQIQEGLDVHVVGGKDELEEQDLLDVDKVGVPLLDDLGHYGRLEGLLDLGHGLGLVMLAEVDDLLEDGCLDVGEGDFGDIVLGVLVHHCLDELGHLGDIGGDGEGVTLLAHLNDFGKDTFDLRHCGTRKAKGVRRWVHKRRIKEWYGGQSQHLAAASTLSGPAFLCYVHSFVFGRRTK